jgi:hypothetical protein
MNPSRFPSLATAAAALAAQMAFAQDAQARVVPIIHDSTLTGIDGLDVDGTLHDVTFVADTGGKSPAPEFTTVHSAHVASKVLGHELKHLENEYLRVDYRDPLYIKGCPHDYDEFVCNIITRDKSPKVFGVELGFVANVTAFYSIATIDYSHCWFRLCNLDLRVQSRDRARAAAAGPVGGWHGRGRGRARGPAQEEVRLKGIYCKSVEDAA